MCALVDPWFLCLLGIRGAFIHRIMIDDGRYIVGMCVNTVSTMTANVLGDCEHENMGMKVMNESLPDLAGATREGRTIDSRSAGRCQRPRCIVL